MACSVCRVVSMQPSPSVGYEPNVPGALAGTDEYVPRLRGGDRITLWVSLDMPVPGDVSGTTVDGEWFPGRVTEVDGMVVGVEWDEKPGWAPWEPEEKCERVEMRGEKWYLLPPAVAEVAAAKKKAKRKAGPAVVRKPGGQLFPPLYAAGDSVEGGTLGTPDVTHATQGSAAGFSAGPLMERAGAAGPVGGTLVERAGTVKDEPDGDQEGSGGVTSLGAMLMSPIPAASKLTFDILTGGEKKHVDPAATSDVSQFWGFAIILKNAHEQQKQR